MSLTKLFNFKYLKENIRKSKAVILLCIFLVPIINSITYLMRASKATMYIPELGNLALLPIICMYIIPVVISFTLFGFIHKRKSADFTLAMPISRKQLFLTNTVGGIVILLLMNVINLLFTLVISMLFSNVLVDYRMLFDIFLIGSIGYIFVFCSANVAISLAGNKITTIVVLLLILFLAPYTHTFVSSGTFKSGEVNEIVCDSKECAPKNFTCMEDKECQDEVDKGIYTANISRKDSTSYTLPYELIGDSIFGGHSEFKMNTSMIKMVLISILEVGIGLVCFKRKKSEVVDTSFKSDRTHYVVRDLTLIPIVSISYMIIRENGFTGGVYDIFKLIFILVMIMTYMIIYDLLTRKKVMNIARSLANLLLVGIIVVLVGEVTNGKVNKVKVNDIEKISLSNFNNSEIKLGYTSNKDIINYVTSIHLDNRLDFSGEVTHYDVTTYTKKGLYTFTITLGNKQEDVLQEMLNGDKEYLESKPKRQERKIFAISSLEGMPLLDKDLVKDIIEDYKKSNGDDTLEFNNATMMNLYYYDNYMVNSVYYDIAGNNELMKRVFEYYNKNLKEYLKNSDGKRLRFWSYTVGYKDGRDYVNGYSYDGISDFVNRHIDDKINPESDYMYISLYVDGSRYYFVTNEVEELDSLVKKLNSNGDDLSDGDTKDEESTY